MRAIVWAAVLSCAAALSSNVQVVNQASGALFFSCGGNQPVHIAANTTFVTHIAAETFVQVCEHFPQLMHLVRCLICLVYILFQLKNSLNQTVYSDNLAPIKNHGYSLIAVDVAGTPRVQNFISVFDRSLNDGFNTARLRVRHFELSVPAFFRNGYPCAVLLPGVQLLGPCRVSERCDRELSRLSTAESVHDQCCVVQWLHSVSWRHCARRVLPGP